MDIPWLSKLQETIFLVNNHDSPLKSFSNTLAFTDNLKHWLSSGRDPVELPYVFKPLFRKSLNILSDLVVKSHYFNKDIFSDQLEREITLGLLGINQEEIDKLGLKIDLEVLGKILRAALNYGVIEDTSTLSMIYSHWFGAVCGLYELSFHKFNRTLPFEAACPGEYKSYPWNYPARKKPLLYASDGSILTFENDDKPKREGIELKGGLMVPFSWVPAQWLLFELLLFHGIGPFSVDFYESDLPITWLLTTMVFEKPADIGIMLSRFTQKLPVQIAMAMTVNQQGVKFRYAWHRHSGGLNPSQALIIALSLSEFVIDATLNVIGNTWEHLRGQSNQDMDVSPKAVEELSHFIDRQEEFASRDKPLARRLRGIGQEINPKQKGAYLQIEKRLDRWRSLNFGIKPGRPPGEPLPPEVTQYVKRLEKKAIILYKKISLLIKKNPNIKDAEIIKRLSRQTIPKQFLNILHEVVKAATTQFSPGNISNLRERTVSAILAKAASIRFNQEISNNSVSCILKSAKK